MSDQPKPTTGEQEWPDAPVMTERQQQIVKDLAVKIVNHANTSVRERLIAVAINAVLAAEQEKSERYRLASLKLDGQLAAEREKVQPLVDALKRLCNAVEKLEGTPIEYPLAMSLAQANTNAKDALAKVGTYPLPDWRTK